MTEETQSSDVVNLFGNSDPRIRRLYERILSDVYELGLGIPLATVIGTLEVAKMAIYETHNR